MLGVMNRCVFVSMQAANWRGFRLRGKRQVGCVYATPVLSYEYVCTGALSVRVYVLDTVLIIKFWLHSTMYVDSQY